MSSCRLEAFSDAVFAIAFALLVLDFNPPAGSCAGYLGSCGRLISAYSISFLSIGIVWANHHSMFVHISRVDRSLLFLNTMLLRTSRSCRFRRSSLRKRFVWELTYGPPHSSTDSC